MIKYSIPIDYNFGINLSVSDEGKFAINTVQD